VSTPSSDGFIQTGVRGLEPYVPGTPIEEAARALGLPPESFVKLASNENPLGMSPRAAEAVRARLARAYQYPEVDCPDLRRAIARREGVDPRAVVVGNGADGVIYALFMALVGQADEVIVPGITFSVYATVVRAMRGLPVFSPLRDLRIDVDDMLARVTPRTKAICVCNPNNPTGDLLVREEIHRLLHRTPEGVMVALDEVYADFADQSLFASGAAAVAAGRPNVFVFRSCSKIYGLAGVRVGWGIGPPEVVESLYRVRPPFDVSVLAAAAAEAALGDEAFYNETLAVTAAGKRYLYAELDRLGLRYLRSHTNFVLIDVGRDSRLVYDALLRQGVIVRAGYRQLPTHIRVTVGTQPQNERFVAALERCP
jgi:histidinol-phosphate aminotransferase